MKQQGYKMTLISTQADEEAQHLYRKLGYIDCGGLVFNHTPFDQPMELFFRKVLQKTTSNLSWSHQLWITSRLGTLTKDLEKRASATLILKGRI